MFGHDDHDEEDSAKENQHGDSAVADDVIKPADDGNDRNDNWQHPGPPPSDNNSDDEDDVEDDRPAASPEPPAESPAEHNQDHAHAGSNNNDLIDLKREALTQLSPLVDKLEQTPDEKFRTLMMMIQASDNQRLVKQAYETALDISDEKERAQALLDIVNEINYFTHNPTKPE